jgi:hypothetical protein
MSCNLVIEYTEPGILDDVRVIKYETAESPEHAQKIVEDLYKDKVRFITNQCIRDIMTLKSYSEFVEMAREFLRYNFSFSAKISGKDGWVDMEIRNKEAVFSGNIARHYRIWQMESSIAMAANIKLLFMRIKDFDFTSIHGQTDWVWRNYGDMYIKYILTGRKNRKFDDTKIKVLRHSCVVLRSNGTREINQETIFMLKIVGEPLITACINRMEMDIKDLKRGDYESETDDESESWSESGSEVAKSADGI